MASNLLITYVFALWNVIHVHPLLLLYLSVDRKGLKSTGYTVQFRVVIAIDFLEGPTPTAFTSSTHPSAPVMHSRGKGTDNSSLEWSRL